MKIRDPKSKTMLNIPQLLSQELSLNPGQVDNALALQAEGGTIPFIARYRKERTGDMDETQLRNLFDRFEYLAELEDRKATVLKSIEEQGKLTDELRAQIEATLEKTALEDLYLPYKPKKRTRANVAREKGLEHLAELIKSLNIPESPKTSLEEEAAMYISEEKGVATAEEAPTLHRDFADIDLLSGQIEMHPADTGIGQFQKSTSAVLKPQRRFGKDNGKVGRRRLRLRAARVHTVVGGDAQLAGRRLEVQGVPGELPEGGGLEIFKREAALRVDRVQPDGAAPAHGLAFGGAGRYGLGPLLPRQRAEVLDLQLQRLELDRARLGRTPVGDVDLALVDGKILNDQPRQGLILFRRRGRCLGRGGSWARLRVPFLAMTLSADPENEFFADGIAEDVIAQLSKIRALKVISRTSVERFRKTELSLQQIAQQLGVTSVLEGGVQRAGERVRINVQLIDAVSDAHLWAESYDRELTAANIFAIQSEVAAAISGALKTTLTAGERTRINSVPTLSLEAWEAYQLGKQRMARRTSAGLTEAQVFLHRAIDLDPAFALAYVELADTLALPPLVLLLSCCPLKEDRDFLTGGEHL